MRRWLQYLEQWRCTLDSGAEVHCLGDFCWIDGQMG